MVWRGFSGKISFAERKTGFQRLYQDHLRHYHLFAKIHHENDFDFHQDTPQCHFFFLSVMEWAARSTDLNPISYR